MPAESAATLSARVLYIEDNPSNILLMQTWAEQHPRLSLLVAETGQSGLAAFQRERPDAVILDMKLPDLDGLDVLRQLLASPLGRDTPIAVLTGDVAAENVRAALRLGASAYWLKPVDMTHLHSDLADLLEGAQGAQGAA